MKVLNINNSYLNTQRFGWNKIINILQNSISNDDIILIDFIDKYFNPWLYQEKIIIWWWGTMTIGGDGNYWLFSDFPLCSPDSLLVLHFP